jgi:hypothetical protein
MGDLWELAKLVGDGTNKIIVAQVQKGQLEQQRYIFGDDANKIVVAEVKHSEVPERGKAKGIKRATEAAT